MSSGENLTINDSPIINSPLTSSPILSAPVSAPLTSSPSNDELVLYDQGEGEIVGKNYIFNGTIATAGTYTFQTQLKSTSNWSSHMSIHINGAEAHRFSKAGADGWSNLLTYNITLQAGDSVSLYIFHDLSGESCYCKSTKIYTLVPVPPTPSNVRYSSGLYYNGVKYEWGKDKGYTEFTYYFPGTTKSYWQGNGCVFSGGLDLNSDGLYLNNSYSNGEMYLPFTKSLSNISKISLEINYYAGGNGNYGGQEVLGLSADSNTLGVYAYSVCNYDKVSGARAQSLIFSGNTLVNAPQYFYDGLEKYTLEIDFGTGKITRINSGANSYTQEYTLSESDLNSCRTFDWIVFRNMAGYNHYIIDANLKFYK